MSEETFQRFARIDPIVERFAELHGQSVLLADVGKNAVSYLMGARAAGVRVVAIADDRLAGRRYWGTKVISAADAQRLAFDAIVVSNSSPVHARATTSRWRAMQMRPVFDLLDGTRSAARAAA